MDCQFLIYRLQSEFLVEVEKAIVVDDEEAFCPHRVLDTVDCVATGSAQGNSDTETSGDD